MPDTSWDAIFNATHTILISESGRITKSSQGFANLLGYTQSALEEMNYRNIVHLADRDQDEALFKDLFNGNQTHFNSEERYIHKEGYTIWVHIISTLYVEDGARFIVTVHDITTQKEKELCVEHLSTHDGLTNLYNRAFFTESLKQTIVKCSRYSCEDYLFYLDINTFKQINDDYGQEVGDLCLKIIASRLTSIFRNTDEIFRVSGDEFAIIVHNVQSEEALTYLISRIQKELDKPILSVANNLTVSITLSLSLGVCKLTHISSPSDALAIVQRSLQKSKAAEGQTIEWASSKEIYEEIELEREIRQAILKEDFVVYYQPIRNLSDMSLAGHEALLRWPKKNISPITILEIAEKLNLVEQLEWNLFKKILKVASSEGLAKRWISVNLNSLLHAKNFRAELTQLLKDYDVNRDSIAFEVIETIRHSDPVVRLLIDIQNDGHSLKLDDFARDYASFVWLKTLPLDSVKIDREFIHGIAKDKHKKLQAITSAMIDVCHSLGIKVVAEGIQRADDLEWLKLAGCDQGQGFHPSLGIPSKDLQKR
jgi:diguanylate cyclase (GGDEF)-like protein/PAS domain S-box-containing protein